MKALLLLLPACLAAQPMPADVSPAALSVDEKERDSRENIPAIAEGLAIGPGSLVADIGTGYGYYAGPGYDLVTGLGTPNGILLARALTVIGHTQMTGTSPVIRTSTSESSASRPAPALSRQSRERVGNAAC